MRAREWLPNAPDPLGGQPQGEGGLRRVVRILREQWLLILAAVIVSVLAAFAFAVSSDESYEAEAVLQITPISDDETYSGIQVIREASDLSPEIETFTRFVETTEVGAEAERLLAERGQAASGGGADVDALPIANSLLVSVVATSGDPALAADTANAYAQGAINVRAADFNADVQAVIDRLVVAAEQIPVSSEDARNAIASRLATLRSLRGGEDPSLTLLSQAGVPGEPSSPGLMLILVAGAFVGLFWGAGAAFVSDALLSRLRRDRQLLEAFNLPIVARVPKSKSRNSGVGALVPDQLGPAALEGYRTLRQNIEVLRRDSQRARTVVFTSAAPAEGKTTSAINAAATLAESGYRVVLVDADLRRPSIGKALSIAPAHGIVSVLGGQVTIDEAIVSTPRFGASLDLLLVSAGEGPRVELLSKVAIERLIEALGERADFIVFDTAPLGTVADALPIATAADDVFVTVRRGHTKMGALRRLVETMGMHDIVVRGFLLVGAQRERVAYGSLYYQEQVPAPRATSTGQEPEVPAGRDGRRRK